MLYSKWSMLDRFFFSITETSNTHQSFRGWLETPTAEMHLTLWSHTINLLSMISCHVLFITSNSLSCICQWITVIAVLLNFRDVKLYNAVKFIGFIYFFHNINFCCNRHDHPRIISDLRMRSSLVYLKLSRIKQMMACRMTWKNSGYAHGKGFNIEIYSDYAK